MMMVRHVVSRTLTALVLLAPLTAAAADGPEISRSRGKPDGVVVLWPRVVPTSDDVAIQGLALQAQSRLAALAAELVDPRRVDTRPAPERVCPLQGCKGRSVGLLLGQRGGGCALVAMVSGPGQMPQQLVPLAGEVALPQTSLPFRAKPEEVVTVTEFARCSDIVVSELDLSGVRSALQSLAPTP